MNKTHISRTPNLISAVVQVVVQIVTGLIDSLPLLLDAALQLILSLADGLLAALVSAIPKIMISIVNAIVGNIDTIIMVGVHLFTALIKDLPKIITEVVKAIPHIIAALVKGFAEYYTHMAAVGTNLIRGLWQGISDTGAWLRDKIFDMFGNDIKNIKDFFGIQSPSTLFAKLGESMGEGIGVGFENAMARVGEDMKNAIPTDFDMPDLNADSQFLYAGGVVPGGASITVNNTFNGVTASEVPYMIDRANSALLRRLSVT